MTSAQTRSDSRPRRSIPLDTPPESTTSVSGQKSSVTPPSGAQNLDSRWARCAPGLPRSVDPLPIVDFLSASYHLVNRHGECVPTSRFRTALKANPKRCKRRPDRRSGWICHPNSTRTQIRCVFFRLLEDRIYLSGNPTQWLQGQNAFSRYRPDETIRLAIRGYLEVLGLSSYRLVPMKISRIDLTFMVDCGTPERSTRTLDRLKQSLSRRHSPICLYRNSLTFDQTSKHRKCSIYRKAAPVPFAGNRKQKIDPSYLRLELTLRSRPIARLFPAEFQTGDWSSADFTEVFKRGFEGFRFGSEQAEGRGKLPAWIIGKDLGVYCIWLHNALDRLPSRTLARHRKRFLEVHGINLDLPPSDLTRQEELDSVCYEQLMDPRNWIGCTRFQD